MGAADEQQKLLSLGLVVQVKSRLETGYNLTQTLIAGFARKVWD